MNNVASFFRWTSDNLFKLIVWGVVLYLLWNGLGFTPNLSIWPWLLLAGGLTTLVLVDTAYHSKVIPGSVRAILHIVGLTMLTFAGWTLIKPQLAASTWEWYHLLYSAGGITISVILLLGVKHLITTGSGKFSASLAIAGIAILAAAVGLIAIVSPEESARAWELFQSGSQSWFTRALDSVDAGEPIVWPTVNWGMFALFFFAIVFLWALVKVKIVGIATGISATAVILPFLIWFGFSSLPDEYKDDLRELRTSATRSSSPPAPSVAPRTTITVENMPRCPKPDEVALKQHFIWKSPTSKQGSRATFAIPNNTMLIRSEGPIRFAGSNERIWSWNDRSFTVHDDVKLVPRFSFLGVCWTGELTNIAFLTFEFQ